MFKKLSNELTRTVKSAELGGLAKEVAEAGIDALLDQEGFVKDLPLVGSVVALAKVGASARDRLLAKKILRFLESLSDIDEKERAEMLEKLEQSEGFRGQVGERLLEILDGLSIDRQPEMVAKTFAAFARGRISDLELKRLVVAIERTPPHELAGARAYAETPAGARIGLGQPDPMMLLALQATGLVATSGGYDGGVFYPTPLLEKFLELDLDR